MVYNQKLADLITAHAKIILAIITVVVHRFVTDGTGDWIVDVAGLILIGAVPNNQGAIERIYPAARAKRLREEGGRLTIEYAVALAIVIIAVAILLSVLL